MDINHILKKLIQNISAFVICINIENPFLNSDYSECVLLATSECILHGYHSPHMLYAKYAIPVINSPCMTAVSGNTLHFMVPHSHDATANMVRTNDFTSNEMLVLRRLW